MWPQLAPRAARRGRAVRQRAHRSRRPDLFGKKRGGRGAGRRRAGPGGRRAVGATVSETGRACGARLERWEGKAYIYMLCYAAHVLNPAAAVVVFKCQMGKWLPELLPLALTLFFTLLFTVTSATMLNPTVISKISRCWIKKNCHHPIGRRLLPRILRWI
jgi:hypothetical protein